MYDVVEKANIINIETTENGKEITLAIQEENIVSWFLRQNERC